MLDGSRAIVGWRGMAAFAGGADDRKRSEEASVPSSDVDVDGT